MIYEKRLVDKVKAIIIIFAISCNTAINAQELGHEAHNHGHEAHEHSRNEIGLSSGALFAFDHKEWGGSVHIHYFRTLSPQSKWSLGGSLEQAWVDGSHFNISVGGKYQIFNRMSIAILPGLTFISHKDEVTQDLSNQAKGLLSIHSELIYDLFYWEDFHLGAAIDYSWEKNDSHSMLGIHAAYSF